jgi:type II secretory pathway pseudopilin PulG
MDGTKAKKLFYVINFLSKLLLVFFWIILIFHPFTSACDPYRTEHHVTCFGFDFASFFIVYLPLSFLPSSVIFQLFALYFAKTKKLDLNLRKTSKNFSILFLVLLIIGIFLGMVLVSGCGARSNARDARRMSDLRQIKAAQETYYQKYTRYAVTQEELANEGIINSLLTDPSTQDEYTDFDGTGIEGGDLDTQTWSVKAALEKNKPFTKEICDKSNLGIKQNSFYFCNEMECGYLNK